MKTVFKPLGIAAAVAAVTAGFSGVTSAQVRSIGNLGDLAIIPYYTVQDDWVTGVHIINTSNNTEVVKLRLRRGSDSADALDFNLVMSPYDEWTGFIQDDAAGNIVFATDDTTCTAPALPNNQAVMPSIFREGAQEGYIEVIGMGSANALQPISIVAKHAAATDTPADCVGVRTNFFIKTALPAQGVVDNETTHQAVVSMLPFNTAGGVGTTCISTTGTVFAPNSITAATDGPGVCESVYDGGSNSLKVSYFFRDATAGTEFGGNAVHIADFSPEGWMTNQESGLLSGDTQGFDYPDLNGGPLGYGATRGLFNALRSPGLLGVSGLINDWSIATARNVSTDWVVTMPGQYTMMDFAVWASTDTDPDPLVSNADVARCGVPAGINPAIEPGVNLCDFRDIPVEATVKPWNREERTIIAESGDLVISPAPPGSVDKVLFPYEVNVIQWTDGINPPVFSSDYASTIDISALDESGWASASVSSATKNVGSGGVGSASGQAICEYAPLPPVGDILPGNSPLPSQRTSAACIPASGQVPIVGFVAWQRSFPSNPDANYGRLIDHSFTSM